MSNRRKTGAAFEKAAENFYRSRDFVILERNWQSGHKELDLVVRKKDTLVFVEVKAARTETFGHPAEWVNDKKQLRLIEAAQKYIDTKQISDVNIQFDVITFDRGKLEHYPNAFEDSSEY